MKTQEKLLKRVEIIKWHVDSEIETRRAERNKNKLEDAGYKLIGEDIGLFVGKLVYKLG